MRYQRNTVFLSIWILILIITASSPAEGQEEPNALLWDLNTEVQNCEMSLFAQEMIVLEARKHLEKEKLLIVIVRPGTGENSTEVTRRRIFNIEQFFLNGRGMMKANEFLVAAGPKIKGLGRYEFYIEGKLTQILLMGKNHYLCHSCCGPDESYYPDKATYDRKPRKKKR